MTGKWGKTALAAAMVFASVQPAQACWSDAEQNAAKIAKLNMMLMSTSLRCRFGADTFQDHYARFVLAHNPIMGSQHGMLKLHFARSMGNGAAVNALDRLVTSYANNFGAGHKTMGCAELKAFAARVADEAHSPATLAAVADAVVGDINLPGATCPVRLAMADIGVTGK